MEGQLGSEPTIEEYVANMVEVFRGVWRVLRDDGTLWLNMGDCYATGAGRVGNCPGGGKQGEQWHGLKTPPNRMPLPGLKPKDLCGMPWRAAFALQKDGWYLRSDIIWAKPNPMPESCTDRPTKSHEYLFLFTKRPTYFWDAEAVREPHTSGPPGIQPPKGDWKARRSAGEKVDGDWSRTKPPSRQPGYVGPPAGRNIRTVWEVEAGPEPLLGWLAENHPAVLMEMLGAANAGDITDTWKIATQAYPGAHFATFPERLVLPCIRAGTSERGCCPECGTAWRRVVEIEDPAGRLGKGYHDHSNDLARGQRGVFAAEGAPVKHTTGWAMGCTCGCVSGIMPRSNALSLSPVPCTVLDPFSGAGTVGVVCAKENRSYIGIDLNPEYAAMAEERIGRAMRLADDDRRQGGFKFDALPSVPSTDAVER